MAGFFLLDGVSSLFDFQTDVNSSDLAAANTAAGTIPAASSSNMNSWKCMANYLSLDITQEFLIRTTFCSGRWVGRTPGLRDINGMLDGFLSQGALISDPLYLFSTAKGIPWIATINTGMTISGCIMAGRNHIGMRSFQNSEQGVSFATDSTFVTPASTWITS